ncbi:MAG: hypothetical protein ACOCTT_00585 [archaeon]
MSKIKNNKIRKDKMSKSSKKTQKMIENLDKTVKDNLRKQVEGIVLSDAPAKKKMEEIEQTMSIIGIKGEEKKKFVKGTLNKIKADEKKQEKLRDILRKV